MAIVPFVLIGDFTRGNGFFRDQDNVLATYKNKDTSEPYFMDFSRAIGSGESIDTVEMTSTGNVTVVGPSISGQGVNFGISGSDGEVKIKIMALTTDRTYVQTLRFIGTNA